MSVASDSEREEIYRLRHEVYARELAQYPTNGMATLRDALDGVNVYVVARLGGKLAGFISITPPGQSGYSIDKYFARVALPFTVDESLYEIRLLTVVNAHRRSELAVLLMYAAFRWVESHGGRQIVAIGRREILDLYLKVGLKPMGKSACCGSVTYDLLHARVSDVRVRLQQFQGLLLRLESKTEWHLNFAMHKPAACFHGGAFFKAVGERFDALERRKRIINADVLDAWFPPSPKVINGLQQHLEWLLRTSPPTGCDGLIENIAKARRVKPINILPGAGSSDLIFRALSRWLSRSSHALILDPMYGEYAHVLEEVIGVTVDRLRLTYENDYELDLERLQNALKDNYDLVLIVNPNNPTGRHVSCAVLEAVLRRVPSQTRVWVDETYVEYAGPDESLETFAVETENVIVCKSMSKAYALSGLRVGYLCAGAHQLESLRATTPPWVVSLPGQLAASLALEDPGYYATRYAQTAQFREQLRQELETLGWDMIQGTANFLLGHLPKKGPSAEQLIRECRQHGLFLRNATFMGTDLGSHAIRVAVKDAATNAEMVSVIKSVTGRRSAACREIDNHGLDGSQFS